MSGCRCAELERENRELRTRLQYAERCVVGLLEHDMIRFAGRARQVVETIRHDPGPPLE